MYCWSWLKKEGRELRKADLAVRVVTNPELSAGAVPLQDKYCHKTESESKLWAGFSLQTSGSVLQPANAVVVCLSTVGAESPMKELEFSIV